MKRALSIVSLPFICAQMIFVVLVMVWLAAHAAEFGGVKIPDRLSVNGKTLYLNGFGRRTYSIVGIHIYGASLYLEHFSTNPDEIIRSPETKLLMFRFEHKVSADEARNAWREGLKSSCMIPCHLDPDDVERFLSKMPAMLVGDNFSLLFTENAVTVTSNGQQIGAITQRRIVEAMLATFLGPRPASLTLEQELLGRHG